MPVRRGRGGPRSLLWLVRVGDDPRRGVAAATVLAGRNEGDQTASAGSYAADPVDARRRWTGAAPVLVARL